MTTSLIQFFFLNDLYCVFSKKKKEKERKGSGELFHHTQTCAYDTLTVAVLGAGVWPCCLPAGVPDLGVALRCNYPRAAWLSQPGPPAPETALPSSGKDGQGGIRGRMRQGTERRREERRLEETCRTSNIRQRRGTMQYLTGIFVAQAWNDFGWRTFKLSFKQIRSNASLFIYEASLFEKITAGGILVSPSANSTDQKLIPHATLISN